MADNCFNCKHFRPHNTEVPEGHGIGICMRYPPRDYSPESGSWDRHYPIIPEAGQCGEWKLLTPSP